MFLILLLKIKFTQLSISPLELQCKPLMERIVHLKTKYCN